MTPEEASKQADSLQALRELRSNTAWREIVLPFIRSKVEIHKLGIRNREVSAEKRSEHLEAFISFEELSGLVEEKTQEIQRRLDAFVSGQREVDVRTMEIQSGLA